jgi:hypothetical protein
MDKPNPYKAPTKGSRPRKRNWPNYLLVAGIAVAALAIKAGAMGGILQAALIGAGVVMFAVGCLSARPDSG